MKKDIAKAIEHLEIASARGNMYADYRLAQIYLFEADIFDENDGKYPLLSQRWQGIFCATASNFGVNTNLRRRMCAPFPMLVYFFSEGEKYI